MNENVKIERDILIKEVQDNKEILPGDRDHLRDAIMITYAAANGSQDRIKDIATANVLWARIHIRTFATNIQIAGQLDAIKNMLRDHLEHDIQPVLQAVSDAKPFDKTCQRLIVIRDILKVSAWPICVFAAIVALAVILQPSIFEVLAKQAH